ncbi:MAG: 2-dehydro-3-deoxy-6-phosphogalactonate aldolase [Devosiaceae bacterium]|nr:2-dehydro-3-deoxy-6-phosphogalactonate aldolase [Devosiaceae bacterium]
MTNKLEIIAILRGIKTNEIEPVFGALIEAGITRIEVTLNSAMALESIQLGARRFGNVCHVGAGTVLTESDVFDVAKTGARFIVSPNCSPEVIRAAGKAKLSSYPGVMIPSEAFCAIEAGATGLKIFPAEIVGPKGIKAMKAVLPGDVPLFAVGGATPNNFSDYARAGCAGFGLGSFLYRPGDTAQRVARQAKAALQAIQEIEKATSS